MMIAGIPGQAEGELLAGDIPCPACSAQLRPYGHACTRAVRGLGDERQTLRPHPSLAASASQSARRAEASRSSESRLRRRPPAAGTARSLPSWVSPTRRCAAG